MSYPSHTCGWKLVIVKSKLAIGGQVDIEYGKNLRNYGPHQFKSTLLTTHFLSFNRINPLLWENFNAKTYFVMKWISLWGVDDKYNNIILGEIQIGHYLSI